MIRVESIAPTEAEILMAKPEALARYEFKKQLEDIRKVKGRATELISLYVPTKKRISDITAYLRNEYSQSSNIKSRTTKKNVTWAIESIMGKLKHFKNVPENGMVFFVGHRSLSGDKTEEVSFLIEPPEPVTTFSYRCDSHFYLEQLEKMLVEKETYGLIVIDRNEATVGVLSGSSIQTIKNLQSRIMGKHRRGGQSALRFERLIEIAAHEYYKKVATIANDSFMAVEDLKGVIFGGPGSTKDFFAEKDYLHHELKKKIVGTFDTGYTDEYGLKELVENAAKALEDMEIAREKKLIKSFLEELRKPDGGLACYGEVEVRRALEMGALEMLMISEGVPRYRTEYTCKNCEEKGIRIVNDLDVVKCKKCQADVEHTQTSDLVEEIFKIADGFGTTVEMISQDSEEGEMLMRAFNGLAGVLRYRIGD